ncbi:MAG: hypothetical protein H6582_05655 [Crocinitomicaceae bacterium]|nr:hypothetical protein [Crocinitomicaceae bacterium]
MTPKIKNSTFFTKKKLNFLLLLGVYTYFSFNTLAQNSVDNTNSLYETVMSKTQAVDDPDKQVGTFDPNNAPSLPIGLVKTIGDKKYIICIDSAYFLPEGAYFSAYMALEFAGGDKKIAFAAKDIKFNPEGIIGGEQSKLMLVSEHFIGLGKNTQLHLPADGSNYVSWDCNGFQSVSLKGEFIFSRDILEPVDNQQNVTAGFQVTVQDLHNMLAMVEFSPFTVKGMQDFEFTVSEATVDMSDYQNPNAALPQCYHEIYGNDINLWRGFHLKYLQVQLPEKLSKHDDPTQIYAQNMFIDEAGVTGEFGANNVLSTNDGDANGWGFSVDNIQVGLTVNQLTSGGMAGEIKIPIMNNNALDYSALITKNETTGKPDYFFTASPDKPMEMSALNSTLTVDPSSTFMMSIKEDKFDPSLVLSGDWKLNNPKAKFQGIQYQNITLVTQFPYITNGQFGLVAPVQAELAAFKVSLNQINLGVQNGEVGLATNIGLNLGDTSSNISVQSGFQIFSKVQQENGKPKLVYDRFNVNSVMVDLATNAINLHGVINFKQGDAVWGDGFQGAIGIKIPKVLKDSEIAMFAAFGKVNNSRYWAIDVTAPLPGNGIKIGTSLSLTQIMGGLSYHMDNTRSVQSIMDAIKSPVTASTAMSSDYVPDASKGISFSAGVGFRYAPASVSADKAEKLLNGEVIFQIEFNSNGGLSNILLAGNAYMLASKQEILAQTAPSYAKGTLAVGYDCDNQIFDMQLTAAANFEDALTAQIWSQLYISPNLWYFHLGRPSARCYVNALNFANLDAYFMVGQQLDPMPAPPPQVSSVLGGMSNSRDNNAIVNGSGFATGASLYVNVGGGYLPVWGKWHAYANAYFGTGFDLTMVKYAPGTHCSGSSEEIGANLWYMQGQVYAYGGMSAGAAKLEETEDGIEVVNNFTVISASMAMLLQGRFPHPSYVYGGVNLQAKVFNLFNLNVTMDFDYGDDCQIVN